MSKNAKIEEKMSVVSQLNEMTAQVKKENRSFSSEELEKFDNLSAEITRLDSEIESEARFAKAAELTEKMNIRNDVMFSTNKLGITAKDADLALRSILWDHRVRPCPTEFIRAAQKLGLDQHNLGVKLYDENELRALGDSPQTTTTNGSGKYLIQDALAPALEIALKTHSNIRSVAKIKRTSGDGDYPINFIDDTANKGVLIAENTVVDNQALAFTRKTMKAYKFSSKAVLLPTELVEDTSSNLISEIGNLLGERISKILTDYHTTGTGSSQPAGIVTGSTLGVTAADTTDFTWQELVALMDSIDPKYLKNCGWMMNTVTRTKIRQLADGNNRPIYIDSLVPGVPDTLLGYPVTLNQAMANPAAGEKPILFGDFSQFWIRDVRDISVNVLRELFAHYDQICYMAWYRGDSLLVTPAAVKHIIMAAS